MEDSVWKVDNSKGVFSLFTSVNRFMQKRGGKEFISARFQNSWGIVYLRVKIEKWR